MAKQSSAALKPEQPATQRRWEFASDRHSALASEQEIFSRRSADGWELIGITESANFERRYYFKRPV